LSLACDTSDRRSRSIPAFGNLPIHDQSLVIPLE